MPIFKQYSEDYHKDGHFVHAPIEGLSHPLPLQTPDITTRIYKKLGHKTGDHVPNELTWKLYEVDLHWTENTGPDTVSQDELESAILDESGPEFTENEIEKILSVVESYSGQYEREVRDLLDELNADQKLNRITGSDIGSGVSGLDVDVEELLENESGLVHFEKSVDEDFSQRELEYIEEHTTPGKISETDTEIFGVEVAPSEAEYYQQLAQCDNILKSLAGFSMATPLEVQRVVPTPPSIGYFYDVESPGVEDELHGGLDHLILSDYRGSEHTDEDIRITLSKSGISVRFNIKDNHIDDYAVVVPEKDIGHMEREKLEDVTTEDMTPGQLMHHGLGTIFECTEVVEDLLDNVPDYQLCPVASF